jgi:hypothetical protein
MNAILIPFEGKQEKISFKSFLEAKTVICNLGWSSPLEIVNLYDGKMLLIDEEGKLKNLTYNSEATRLAHASESIYPSDSLCGDVILIDDVEEFDNLPYE